MSNTLFYTIVFLLPANLGLHFYITEAFIKGLPIDYLIPTLYVQDILIAILLIRDRLKSLHILNKYLIWFLFAILLSSFSATLFIPSITSVARVFLYSGFMMYASRNANMQKVFKVVAVSVFFLCLLGVAQWFHQGSVFNNYKIFGEQIYSASSKGIHTENFLGKVKVPPYGLFRHPNTFAGFLSIVLIWILKVITTSNTKVSKYGFLFVFLLGTYTLFLTFSLVAIVAFLLGLILILLNYTNFFRKTTMATILVLGTILPLVLGYHFKTPSVLRRSYLLESSYRMFVRNPLFGVGYNNFTAVLDEVFPSQYEPRFTQPAHNIFILVLVEGGVFAGACFFLFFMDVFKTAPYILKISLIQVLTLGIFDHYLITMHQTFLLLWLIFGLSLSRIR